MVTIYARHGEDVESLIKRFKNAVERDGILNVAAQHAHFRSPSFVKHENYQKLKYKKKMLKLRPELDKKLRQEY